MKQPVQAMSECVDLRCVETSCEQQWLYLIGEEGVVYSQTQNCFAGLDAAGVLAYRAFDEGAQVDELLSLHDSNSAQTETLNIIFKLVQGVFPTTESQQESHLWPDPASASTSTEIANLEINGIPIFFEYPSEENLKFLSQDCFQSCSIPAANTPARLRLHTQRTGDRWAIYINGYEFFSLLRKEQIGLGLLHAVRSLLSAHSDYDIAFHAAMVADNEHGILLCAPRESGKSTLAAHLAANDFRLLTDEPALLRLDTESVSSLSLPISLKEGSWNILRDDWPQLAKNSIHVRSDSTTIKLLHLPKGQKFCSPRRLTHIVFPRYSPLSAASVERLTPVHTLSLLNAGGILLQTNLGKDNFERLLRLLCKTTASIVHYSSLQEAEQLIYTLLERDPAWVRGKPPCHSQNYR